MAIIDNKRQVPMMTPALSQTTRTLVVVSLKRANGMEAVRLALFLPLLCFRRYLLLSIRVNNHKLIPS